MRIYTRIEMEMRTGRVLHACSSEYAGPIAWLKGGIPEKTTFPPGVR